jgi:carboxyl-terminal processing protease
MRDVIRVVSVKSKMIEPGYAFVRISQFQERTVEDLVKHVNDLFRQGPVKGLVLDLRNDPGGLLHSARGRVGRVPAAALAGGVDQRPQR